MKWSIVCRCPFPLRLRSSRDLIGWRLKRVSMKIAFFASEVFPFAKTGGLADVCGALPLALRKLGIEVVVFMPRYKAVDGAKIKLKKINATTAQAFLDKDVPVYFIEQDKYFNRDGLYGNKEGDYPDNLE